MTLLEYRLVNLLRALILVLVKDHFNKIKDQYCIKIIKDKNSTDYKLQKVK